MSDHPSSSHPMQNDQTGAVHGADGCASTAKLSIHPNYLQDLGRKADNAAHMIVRDLDLLVCGKIDINQDDKIELVSALCSALQALMSLKAEKSPALDKIAVPLERAKDALNRKCLLRAE